MTSGNRLDNGRASDDKRPTMHPRGLIWGLVLLAAEAVVGCGGGDKNGAFATYYADGAAWCDWNAMCAVQTKEACLADWPQRADVLAAISSGHFTGAEIDRCDQASRALDTCGLAQTCAQSMNGNPCASQNQVFMQLCGPLNAQIMLEHNKTAP
jgi:hypothetical protein